MSKHGLAHEPFRRFKAFFDENKDSRTRMRHLLDNGDFQPVGKKYVWKFTDGSELIIDRYKKATSSHLLFCDTNKIGLVVSTI